MAETAKDTLAWWKAVPSNAGGKLRAGLSAERERAVLEAWRRASTR